MTTNPVASVPEEWKPVVGYPFYEVSNCGRVRSWAKRGSNMGKLTSPRILKTFIRAGRYPSVGLHCGGSVKVAYVHRLVAESFIGPCPKGHEVAHNNGNSKDPRSENLRYATPKQNNADKFRHGTSVSVVGEKCGNVKLTGDDVRSILRFLNDGWNKTFIARLFGVHRMCISCISRGLTWKHIGRNLEAERSNP